MQINVSARHGDLNPDTQETVSQKAGKLQRFFDRITSINVIIDLKNNDQPEVEIQVSAEQSPDFVAHDKGNNILSAVESVVHKLEHQIKKHKEKITSHRNAGLKHAEIPETEE